MDKNEIIWTDKALCDLEDIYDFASIKSVQAAGKIIKAIFNKPHKVLIKGFEFSGQIDEYNPKSRSDENFFRKALPAIDYRLLATS